MLVTILNSADSVRIFLKLIKIFLLFFTFFSFVLRFVSIRCCFFVPHSCFLSLLLGRLHINTVLSSLLFFFLFSFSFSLFLSSLSTALTLMPCSVLLPYPCLCQHRFEYDIYRRSVFAVECMTANCNNDENTEGFKNDRRAHRTRAVAAAESKGGKGYNSQKKMQRMKKNKNKNKFLLRRPYYVVAATRK